MKKALLLLNPKAGRQSARTGLYSILASLAPAYEVTVHITRSGEDVTARAAACEFPCLIVCGGDGTLSRAAAGLLANPRREEIALGYIPCGTANDVAATLDIPCSPSAAALYLRRNFPKRHDMGLFNDCPFIYTAAFGVFSKTSYKTPQDVKNLFGGLAYLVEGAGELLSLPSYHLTVETPEKTLSLDDITYLGITNTHFVGGGILRLPPDFALLDDGRLELLAIKRPETLIETENILRSLMTRQYNNEYLTLMQASAFTLTLDRPAAWTLDGEAGGEAERAEVDCLAGALHFLRK